MRGCKRRWAMSGQFMQPVLVDLQRIFGLELFLTIWAMLTRSICMDLNVHPQTLPKELIGKRGGAISHERCPDCSYDLYLWTHREFLALKFFPQYGQRSPEVSVCICTCTCIKKFTKPYQMIRKIRAQGVCVEGEGGYGHKDLVNICLLI